jgi:molecular chaperone DnaK (HSP70)
LIGCLRLRCRTFRASLGQSSVVVEVVEGESVNPDNCIKIGQCVVSDLPPDLPAGSVVELSFNYEKDGTLAISARIPSARRSVQTQIKRELQSDPTRFNYWVSLLTGKPPTTDSATPVNAESSNEQGIPKSPYELLHDANFSIGSNAVDNSLAKSVVQPLVKQVNACQRELIFLKDKLSEYNNRSAGGSVQRVQNSTSVAKIKNRMDTTAKKMQVAIIDLGKQCFQDDVELSGVEALYDRCEHLLKQTKS